MTNVLVTGGAGFIGSCLVRQFLEATDHRVVTLDKLTYAGNLDSLQEVFNHPRHVFVEGDIRNADLVSQLLGDHRIEAVAHLAAESHVDRSIDGPAAFVETNVVGTFALVQAVLDYWNSLPSAVRDRCRFLHVSTDEVYGSLGPSGLFTEQSPYQPSSPYSASKAASDHFVRAYHRTYGLPALITNCSNNYGPRQFPEKLIPLMVLNALEGKSLPVYGDGKNVRDWVFVEDHCAALRLVLERGRPGETYNIGSGSERTNIELVELLCEIVDRLRPGLAHGPCRGLITFVRDRPGHDRRYAVDAAKIGRELGWRAEHDLASGLERTVGWYLQNKAWTDRVASGGYRRQRLGMVAESVS